MMENRFEQLNEKQKQNSLKILSELYYLFSFKLKKWEVFEPYQNKNIWVYYLSINGNNYPISQEDFEILRVLGIDVVIV